MFWSLLILTAVGAGALYAGMRVRLPIDGIDMAALPKQSAPDGDGEDGAPPPCPYCAEAPPAMTPAVARRYDRNLAAMDRLIAAGQYGKALERVEKVLPDAPLADHYRLLVAVYECFAGLCEDLAPHDVLLLFDRLLGEGAALPFALRHDELPELSMVLGYALRRWPGADTESGLNALLVFLRGKHPLLTALCKNDPQSVAETLDDMTADVYRTWRRGPGETLPEVIARIEKQVGMGR